MIDEKLMHRLRRTAALIRREDPQGTTPPLGGRGRGHGYILRRLAECDGISQQQLANSLDLRPQTLSQALGALEREGYIHRLANESDARVTLVYITPSGRRHNEILAREHAAQAKAFFAPLTETEKEQLFTILCKLSAHQAPPSPDKPYGEDVL